jgi:tagaturonate reductase
VLPLLTGDLWPASAYARDQLPERVLQFGSGMLLRALCDAAVDSANRAGKHAPPGRIVVVQSTAEGAPRARALNAQHGLFTLVERGLSGGAPLERIGLIGTVSRALAADDQWNVVRDVATGPEMQVIISNVSEAGFRIDAPFPGRLTDALHARFTYAPDAPPVFVIPTELVPDNGPRLAAMVHDLAGKYDQTFRDWLTARVRFCSSLVDRIVTAPPPDQHAALEAQLGYRDALLTVTEPYALWAIETDPAELRAVLPIESASVIFAPDITFYRERKLRLLNAVHTAAAPLALLAGVRTVREATVHPLLAPFLKQLFEEIIPATDLPAGEARAFAQQVLERFANPWLDHEWRVIATNQEEKFRIRVVPLIVRRHGPDLALAAAAHLLFTRAPLESLGEAARIPEFARKTTGWVALLAGEGVEDAPAHD